MNESQHAVAQVYLCALHTMWCKCSVQPQSRVMSFFCTGRCGASRLRKTLASQPKGVTPAVALTALFFTLLECSCREGPEHFGPTPLAFGGSRRLWFVKPSTRVSWLRIYDHQLFLCTTLDLRSIASPVHCVGSRVQRPHHDRGWNVLLANREEMNKFGRGRHVSRFQYTNVQTQTRWNQTCRTNSNTLVPCE